MSKVKTLLLLVILVSILIGGLVITHKDPLQSDYGGELLFPDVLGKLNQVTSLEIEYLEKYSLALIDGEWVIPERGNFPASAATIRAFLRGLAQLERVEPKTGKASLYPKLGLNMSNGKSIAAKIKLKIGLDVIATVRLGTYSKSKHQSDLAQIYVLANQDPQAWLVEGRLADNRQIIDFVSTKLLQLDRPRISRVTLRHRDGDIVDVTRDDELSMSFRISNSSSPMKPDVQWQVDDVGYGMAHMTLKAVHDVVEKSAPPDFEVNLETFDGLSIELKGFKKEPQLTTAELVAAVNPNVATEADLERLEAEVASLNRKWSGFSFTMSPYEADKFDYRLRELITIQDQ